jgi:hypothetical protein
LDALSRQTGVSFRTAADYEDRAITLRVRALPLGVLKDEIAALYGDVWKTEGSGDPPVYVLTASDARRARQKRFDQVYEKTLRAALMQEAREFAQNGPPSELLKSLGDSVDGYPVGEEFKARGAILSQLSPDALEHLFAGEGIRLRLADATGPTGAMLWKFVERFAMPESTGWEAKDRANAWVHFSSERYYLGQANPSGIQSSARGLPLRDLHFTIGGPSGRSSSYNLVVPGERFAPLLESALADLRRGEEQDPAERRRAGGDALGRTLPARFPPEDRQYARGELLLALAEAMDVNLVADSHTKRNVVCPIIGNHALEAALDEIAAADGSFWRADRGVVRVRSRYWWLDDEAEPPATAFQSWQERMRAPGYLILPEAERIGALTSDQQARVRLRIPEAEPACTPWMRFYAALPVPQRMQAAGPGLPFWKVNPGIRHLLLTGGSADGMLGHPLFEETVTGGAAMLTIREEPPRKEGGKPVPPAVTFDLRPLPDVTGRIRGFGEKVRFVLPHRGERPDPDPARDGLKGLGG